MGLQELIQFITNGEPVDAGVANRAPRTNDANIRYLWEVLRAAEIGSTVFMYNQAVEADTVVGTPVYYNAANGRFERGLTQVVAVDGVFDTGETSQIWGVVHTKSSSKVADILLFGYAELDISAAIAGSDAAGLYYLSSQVAGRLTRTRPAIAIPVLRSDGQGQVFVNPHWIDALAAHTHHQFVLTAEPAGTHIPPSPGGVHEITAADTALSGWLPADDAIFEGNAPAGAVFGYNIQADSALAAVFPPVPTDAAFVEITKESVDETDYPVGGRVPDELVQIDRNGIWWMSDCYDQVPWPADLDTSLSSSDSISDGCPIDVNMQLRLHFIKSAFFTDTTAVTDLVSVDNRLVIECQNKPGVAASKGPLQIGLNLAFAAGVLDVRRPLAFKQINADDNTFELGPVVEGLVAGSANITLSGTAVERSVPGDDESPLMHSGVVTITVATDGSTELPVQLVRLDSVSEEYYEETMYLGFEAGEEAEYRARIHVPATLGITSPKLKIRLRILGRSAGTLPSLTLTYRRIPAPTLGGASVALPTSDSAVTISTALAVSNANEYVEVESDEITVAAGDDFLFTVQRSASDGYAGELGIIRHAGVLVAGS